MADSTNFVDNLNAVDFDTFANEASRTNALTAARALVRRLETPLDTGMHMSHMMPAFNAAMRVAMDQRVFEKLEINPATPKSPEDLVSEGDPALLNRFLKHLAAMNMIKSAGPNLYLPTRHSKSFTDPKINSTVDYYQKINTPAFAALPKFLAANKYVLPPIAETDNWRFMVGRDEPHFNWLSNRPELLMNFQNLMAGYTSQRSSWVEVYPGRTLLENAKPQGDILIDVGGSLGHDLTKYLDSFPQSAGRLVLQDLPDVIAEAKKTVATGITAEPQDIFTKQQRPGARAYFMHSVLHDWPDEKCREILANLKTAMTPGYSRLLINEMVVPASNPSSWATSIDLTMLALVAAKERTEGEWQTLLGESGFKVVKIWREDHATEAVIEAEVA